jgi:hypothetical protein
MSPPYVSIFGLCDVLECELSLSLQVFDNYAVTVMIGEDPYTLGLFDTAGEFALVFAARRRCMLNPS